MTQYCYVIDRVTEPCLVFKDEMECIRHCKKIGYDKYTINVKEQGDPCWSFGGIIKIEKGECKCQLG